MGLTNGQILEETKIVKIAAIALFILVTPFLLGAHSGHHSVPVLTAELAQPLPHFFKEWMNAIGPFHLLFLHFPIALVTMTVVAETLSLWFPNPIFSQSARFMIYAAAFLAPITALLGLAFAYGQHYEGLSLDLFLWHRYLGLVTAGLAIITALLKRQSINGTNFSQIVYYSSLLILFIAVSLTGTFGGSLAFGIDVW